MSTFGLVTLFSWLYRIRPSVVHEPFSPIEPSNEGLCTNFANAHVTPNQLRWDPFDLPQGSEHVDFVTGLRTVAGAGDAATRNGLAIHIYHANQNMGKKAFYNADGDFLICKCTHRETRFLGCCTLITLALIKFHSFLSSTAWEIGYHNRVWKNDGPSKRDLRYSTWCSVLG
jgi:hypothetical protein